MSINPWILAIRPKTLTGGVSPVIMAAALAYVNGVFNLFGFISCLMVALSLQIGSNLANDYFDYFKKVDTDKRLGPTRVTQAGLIKPHKVKMGFIISFISSLIFSIYPILVGGKIILILGLVCIFVALMYTAGPLPLSHIGMGEIFAFIFFGPVPVGFSFYIMSGYFSVEAFVVGFLPGLFSVAMISINNLRDYHTDIEANKKTLAVLFGEKRARAETAFFLILPNLFIPILFFVLFGQKLLLLMIPMSLLTIITVKKILYDPLTEDFNNHLAFSGKLNLMSALVYSTLIIIGKFI